ncbi:MAG: hypothetical protein E7028_02730 [Planctomycetaceae bacterium]|nr:hypothetical protein [Planctomycetaceae bacterium]
MKKVKCPVCGRVSEVENPVPGMNCENCSSKLIGENARVSSTCRFCQEEILSHETEIFCPGCGGEYHADCWLDNDGCGEEGCAYQDCLAPMEIPLSVSSPAPVQLPETASARNAVDPMAVEGENSSDEGEYFTIQNVPDSSVKTAEDEGKLFEEKMAAIRKREEIPEEKGFSWQEVLDWKNTPRDTKYDFDGPWLKDPYLFQKVKNYVIFILGGAVGGTVLGFSLVLICLILKFIIFHTGISFGFMVFLLAAGILMGIASAVYFAHRTMATLIDN